MSMERYPAVGVTKQQQFNDYFFQFFIVRRFIYWRIGDGEIERDLVSHLSSHMLPSVAVTNWHQVPILYLASIGVHIYTSDAGRSTICLIS